MLLKTCLFCYFLFLSYLVTSEFLLWKMRNQLFPVLPRLLTSTFVPLLSILPVQFQLDPTWATGLLCLLHSHCLGRHLPYVSRHVHRDRMGLCLSEYGFMCFSG